MRIFTSFSCSFERMSSSCFVQRAWKLESWLSILDRAGGFTREHSAGHFSASRKTHSYLHEWGSRQAAVLRDGRTDSWQDETLKLVISSDEIMRSIIQKRKRHKDMNQDDRVPNESL